MLDKQLNYSLSSCSHKLMWKKDNNLKCITLVDVKEKKHAAFFLIHMVVELQLVVDPLSLSSLSFVEICFLLPGHNYAS